MRWLAPIVFLLFFFLGLNLQEVQVSEKPVKSETLEQNRFTLRALAVDNFGQGIFATIEVEVSEGNGIFLDVSKVSYQEDFQEAVRRAKGCAELFTGKDLDVYEIKLKVKGAGERVNGPSASALLSLFFISLLEGKKIMPGIAITGDVKEDCKIRKVIGIEKKAEVASSHGYRILVIPYESQVDDELLEHRYELKVVRVKDMSELVQVALED